MKQEDKDLLLKDLCARIPYGFEASVRGSDEELQSFKILGIKGDQIWVKNEILDVNKFESIEVIKPYLRPMSSMTEEEKKEYENCYQSDDTTTATLLVDFYNKKHFDHRGLIEKGLALEAPKDMYKLND